MLNAQYYGHPGWMMGPGGMGYDGWGWMAGVHGLLWLVVRMVLAAAGVARIRGLWLGPARSGGESSARALLDQRYARGEIDREAYLQMKKDLG